MQTGLQLVFLPNFQDNKFLVLILTEGLIQLTETKTGSIFQRITIDKNATTPA